MNNVKHPDFYVNHVFIPYLHRRLAVCQIMGNDIGKAESWQALYDVKG